MRDKYIKSLMALYMSTSLQGSELLLNDTKRSDTNAMVVLFDTAGLNNYNSCSSLVENNLSKYNSLVSKKSLRKMNISSIEYFTFDEQIQNLGKVKSNRIGKLFRESKELMLDVKNELKKDKSLKAKDVISIFSFINNLVAQNYTSHNNIGVVVFSNLRDSIHSKEQRDSIKPIQINEKITLYLYAASGLECIDATTKQILSANKSIENYYKSFLIGSKISVNNTYYGDINEQY